MDNLFELIYNAHQAINELLRGQETEEQRWERFRRNLIEAREEWQRQEAVVFQIQRFEITQRDIENIARTIGITVDLAVFLFTFIYLPPMNFGDMVENGYVNNTEFMRQQYNENPLLFYLFYSRGEDLRIRTMASILSVVAERGVRRGIVNMSRGFINMGRGVIRAWNYVRDRLESSVEIPLINAPNISRNIEECGICFGEFNRDNPRVRVFTCDHVFHVSCINEWRRMGGGCPFCQTTETITRPIMYRFSFYSNEPLTVDTKEKYTLQLVDKLDKLINMLESPKTSKNVKSFIELTIIMMYIKTILIFKEKYNIRYEDTQRLIGF